MDIVSLELFVLLAFMIIGSLVAVEVRDLLSSIICVGAVGFGLALVDLFLGAPDLAITQVVVEILALVILLRVVVTREDQTHETPKDTLTVGATALVLGGLIAAAVFVMTDMAPFGKPLFGAEGRQAAALAAERQQAEGRAARREAEPPAEAATLAEVTAREFGPPQTQTSAEQYVAQGLEKTGASNYVMGVLLDFRAYDTLGEATVIFVSIIGAYAVLRKVGRKRHGNLGEEA